MYFSKWYAIHCLSLTFLFFCTRTLNLFSFSFKQIAFLKVYTQYISKYSQVLQELAELKRLAPKFTEFLEVCCELFYSIYSNNLYLLSFPELFSTKSCRRAGYQCLPHSACATNTSLCPPAQRTRKAHRLRYLFISSCLLSRLFY